MQKNELIRLDARLHDVIDHAVFAAKISNGHAFVAVAKQKGGTLIEGFRSLDRVTVEFSPFDMSTAHIISAPDTGR